MKKMMAVAALALFGSFAMAEESQTAVDKLIAAVPQSKIVEFSSLFKETGAKYAGDYLSFVTEYTSSSNKVELVKKYLPKLEKAYEDAKSETVPEAQAGQKAQLLTEFKNLIAAIKGTLALSSPKLDALKNLVKPAAPAAK